MVARGFEINNLELYFNHELCQSWYPRKNFRRFFLHSFQHSNNKITKMPITSKSNIRSRWYRPNEKPLKSQGVPQLNEPKGEILINKNDKLIDDLSSVKPPKVAAKREEKKKSKSSKEK